MSEPILVTGGAGYIGAHVCKALAENGFLPIAYDNLSTGHAYAVQWGPLIRADLRDVEALRLALCCYRPKAVMHFAANAIVSESMVNPSLYYLNNVGSTIALLEAMREQEILSLVFSSTCAIYGESSPFKHLTEKDSPRPINPYGRSKWMIESMLDDFEMAYGFCSIRLRYFNAAGADSELKIGEDHTPETHLIPSLIQSALGLRNPISIYGTNFQTEDGTAVRDYIHVQDLAEAHVSALKYLLSEKRSVALNLGTGRGTSISQLIQHIEKYSGKTIPFEKKERRAGEPPFLCAAAELAKSTLGWSARYSLEQIIASAWQWQESLASKQVDQGELA